MNQKEKVSSYVHRPYHLHADPIKAEEIIRFSRSQCGINLGVGTMVLSLLEAHPEQAPEWESRYKFYITQAREYQKALTRDLSHVGWNDYAMMRWLILADQQSLLDIVKFTKEPGKKGDLACWMVRSMINQCQKFKIDFLPLIDMTPELWDAATHRARAADINPKKQ